MKSPSWLIVVVAVFTAVFAQTAFAQDTPPKAPPVLQLAQPEDLTAQVEYYVGRLEEAVATEDDYKDLQERIAKDSNTLIVIALSLGLYDKDNDYKAAAPAIIKAAQQLATAKTYAEAKAGVEAVKKATKSKDQAPALKWEKAAVLRELMLAVPAINTQLKRNIRLRRPKRDGPKAAGRAAVLAVIAQASMYHSGDTKKPTETKEWFKWCLQMRDGAAEVNAAARKADKDAARKGMEKLTESCHGCHTVFHPEALGKENEDVEE
jgi:hypothetical protein